MLATELPAGPPPMTMSARGCSVRPKTVSFVEVKQGSHNGTVHPSGKYYYNSNSDLITSPVPAVEIADITDITKPKLIGKFVANSCGADRRVAGIERAVRRRDLRGDTRIRELDAHRASAPLPEDDDDLPDPHLTDARHADVLPRLHAAMLTLPPQASGVMEELAGIHHSIADLLHEMPTATAPALACDRRGWARTAGSPSRGRARGGTSSLQGNGAAVPGAGLVAWNAASSDH